MGSSLHGGCQTTKAVAVASYRHKQGMVYGAPPATASKRPWLSQEGECLPQGDEYEDVLKRLDAYLVRWKAKNMLTSYELYPRSDFLGDRTQYVETDLEGSDLRRLARHLQLWLCELGLVRWRIVIPKPADGQHWMIYPHVMFKGAKEVPMSELESSELEQTISLTSPQSIAPRRWFRRRTRGFNSRKQLSAISLNLRKYPAARKKVL